ncbi:MAG: Na(+)/H(+) antiporter subunit D [Oceanipulchritudo sp.]
MSAIADLPPALWLLGAALLLCFTPNRASALLTVLVPLGALALLLQMEPGMSHSLSVAGLELRPLELGRVNFVFGVIFLLISSIASVYAWHVEDRWQRVMATAYAAGALGVTFAGDFFTLLVFWEVMAVGSAWLVFARRQPDSIRAGFRYLIVHMAGGSILLGGILLHYRETGTLLLNAFSPGDDLAAWLILIGVCINVALPPLHAWLPDAYPKATVTGAIYMSALTTKSAVYVLLILFPGWDILIYMGVIMALYGVVYAVLANDIRQILAYHIISQVGYMVAGVGIGTELSMNGTVAHAYSHILYKALLFMGAGAVIQATGVSRLSDLGGLAGKMRPVVCLFMIGAFSISGFPLFNGFISKSIIVSAAGEAHYPVVMLGLLLASVGTFLHTGLKIPVFTFWGRDARLEVRRLPANMYLAMSVTALLCILYGVAPGLLYSILPYNRSYHPYTAYHLVESVQLLTFTFIAFWIFREKLAGERCIALDTDWFYRRGAALLDGLLLQPVNGFFTACASLRGKIVEGVIRAFRNPYRWLRMNAGPSGAFMPDRERPYLASPVVWVLLAFVLLASTAILA